MATKNFCKGDGSCLLQCQCDCYDQIDSEGRIVTKETDDDVSDDTSEWIKRVVCTCGHREHEGWCPSPHGSCKPVNCRAYSVCGNKSPKFMTYAHQGCCGANCAIRLGPIRNTNEVGECPICFVQETFVELKCGHKMCFECWNHIADFGTQNCSMCRRTNDWSSST